MQPRCDSVRQAEATDLLHDLAVVEEAVLALPLECWKVVGVVAMRLMLLWTLHLCLRSCVVT